MCGYGYGCCYCCSRGVVGGIGRRGVEVMSGVKDFGG